MVLPTCRPTRDARDQDREEHAGSEEFGGAMVVFGAGMCEYKHED